MSALPIVQLIDSPLERRSHERVSTSIPVTVTGGTGTLSTRCHDAAERGLGFTWPEPLAPGSPVRMELEVTVPLRVTLGPEIGALVIDGPEQSEFLRVSGVVRRCEPHGPTDHWVGVSIDEPSCVDDAETLRFMELWLDYIREEQHGWC